MESIIIAFLDFITLKPDGAMRGGCLVTDLETNPLEFRCTGAIRPTSLQRHLYGKKLNEYVCVELVGLPILKNIVQTPNLILVLFSEFLKIRPKLEIPVLKLDRSPDGKIVSLSALPGYEEEVKPAFVTLKKLGGQENLLEPFDRIKNALEEAHKQKVADKPGH